MSRGSTSDPPRPGPGSDGDSIDAVYLWVDGSDPSFRASLASSLAARTPGARPDAAPRRFRDNGELRHSLRSVERHAPWIRRFHLVTNGQAPTWLDRSSERVTLVPHRAICPRPDALPTFNSNALEWWLHRIPGLARRFVYFNDDLFLGRDVSPETYAGPSGSPRLFFEENRIRTEVKTGATHDLAYAFTLRALDRRRPRAPARRHGSAYDRRRLVDRLRLRAPRRYLPAHVPQLYDRDLLARLALAFADEVSATTTHAFRSADDLVMRIVYAFHLLESRERIDGIEVKSLPWDSEDYVFVPLVDDVRAVQAGFARIETLSPRFVCVNDELPDGVADDHPTLRALRTWMHDAYPTPSGFELAT